MDNSAQYGIRWVKNIYGGHNSPAPVELVVATGYQGATACHLRPGDPLIKLSDGTVAQSVAGGAIDYIMCGVKQYWDGSVMRTNRFLPYGTTWTTEERKAIILGIPSISGIWEVDCDDKVTFTTQATYRAAIGENVNLIYVADTTNMYSNPRLNIDGHATTAALNFRIEGISKTLANMDFAGSYVKLYVSVNLHQMAPFYGPTGSAGV